MLQAFLPKAWEEPQDQGYPGISSFDNAGSRVDARWLIESLQRFCGEYGFFPKSGTWATNELRGDLLCLALESEFLLTCL